MGFGEWPELKDMAKETQAFTPVSGTIYQNTTPYPQIILVNAYLYLGAAASTTLVGSAGVTSLYGPTSPPNQSGLAGVLNAGLRGFSPAGSQGLNINTAFTLIIPAGWYWQLTSTLTGDATQVIVTTRIWGPVAPGY